MLSFFGVLDWDCEVLVRSIIMMHGGEFILKVARKFAGLAELGYFCKPPC